METGSVREREGAPSPGVAGLPRVAPWPTGRLRLLILLGLLTPLFATIQWLVAREGAPRVEVELVPDTVEVPVEVEVTVERIVERVVYLPAPDETAAPEPPDQTATPEPPTERADPGAAPPAGGP